MARFELQIFGDESTTPGLVTYGLVVFPDAKYERYARYAWHKVIKAFGAKSNAKIHARSLFSGHARQKTEWSHLSESDSSELATGLMTAIRSEGALFSVGVVHLNTYPSEGIPDGLDASGEQKFNPWSQPVFYGFGFIAAVVGLTSNGGVMRPGMPYKLFLDPISNAVKLFSIWPSMQVVKLMQATGLQPMKFIEKPQMLDAADLYAYAAGRALADGDARNKEACKTIYELAGGIKTHYWWNPEGKLSPYMAEKLADEKREQG